MKAVTFSFAEESERKLPPCFQMSPKKKKPKKSKAAPKTKKHPASAVAVVENSENVIVGRPAKKRAVAVNRQKKDPSTEQVNRQKKDPTEQRQEPQTTNVARTPVALPRISKKMTVVQLQEEATCRGFDQMNLPNKKSDLLNFLMDGSIYLKETPAWKQVEQLKQQMEQEWFSLEQKSSAVREEEERKAEQRREAKELKKLELRRKEQEVRHMEQEVRRKEQEVESAHRKQEIQNQKACQQQEIQNQKARRQQEIQNQKPEHKHSYMRVHPHPLARTRDLLNDGRPRNDYYVECRVCRRAGCCVWTCEACCFDICETCFINENKTEQEKTQDRDKQERAWLDYLRRDEEALAKIKREHLNQWDANKQFKKSSISLLPMNKKPDGNAMQGFTVWCSCTWDSYSYEDPTKEFDSTWKTAEDANARARYLFIWKNCWGHGPDELIEQACQEPHTEEEKEGLKTFSIDHQKCGTWTVSVVPDFAYKYLSNATTNRHNYDNGSPPKGGYV
jgi:hypothetical protein